MSGLIERMRELADICEREKPVGVWPGTNTVKMLRDSADALAAKPDLSALRKLLERALSRCKSCRCYSIAATCMCLTQLDVEKITAAIAQVEQSAPQATNSCPVCDAREDGVTDEMVERALGAWYLDRFSDTGGMRAALEAARRGGV